ncbi:hypothetical protein D4764_10G0004380 [Takifugu flavidus]|uniref:Uncharacterized protein n=1 Tax=Takifugu flavidus TaxID=433684 RepID=A0A5C6PKZ9_9TELE|nr:hypothetical protein D4764_10G0004380 [Takifugu flavidus]
MKTTRLLADMEEEAALEEKQVGDIERTAKETETKFAVAARGNITDEDWENLQKQGEPSGSAEVKKIQLLDSVEDRTAKDLRLSSYTTAEDIFRVIENRYGNKSTIALEILEELEKMPHVRGNQPRKVIDLIQSVEKALADLTELGNSGAMRNPLVIKSLESKLPDYVKRDWLMFMVDPKNRVTSDNHFDMLLKFLKKSGRSTGEARTAKDCGKSVRPSRKKI